MLRSAVLITTEAGSVASKGAIADVLPHRAARALRACRHAALVLSAIATAHHDGDECDSGAPGDGAASLARDFWGVHTIGNHGSAQVWVLFRDGIGQAIARAAIDQAAAAVGQQCLFDGIDPQVSGLPSLRHAVRRRGLGGSG